MPLFQVSAVAALFKIRSYSLNLASAGSRRMRPAREVYLGRYAWRLFMRLLSITAQNALDCVFWVYKCSDTSCIPSATLLVLSLASSISLLKGLQSRIMHSKISPLLCLLSVTDLVSAGLIAKRQSHGRSLSERSIQVGWSLQSNTCPSDSTSCGGGACCPSSLFCNPAGNDEVAACCATGKRWI